MNRRGHLAAVTSKFKTDGKPAENLRANISLFVKETKRSLQDLLKNIDISTSTVNSVLYGKAMDCMTATAAALARCMEVSIDELIGACTIPVKLLDIMRNWRDLPDHGKNTLEWFSNYLRDLYNKKPKGDHVIPVIHPKVDSLGNLVIPEKLTSIDISKTVGSEICRKIMLGLELGVDYYMPLYGPYDVLLIANDRPAMSSEIAVLVIDGNLYLARRLMDGAEAKYFSIRDGKYRVKETECDHIMGYVADSIHDTRTYIDDGRF